MTINNGETPDGVEPPNHDDETSTELFEVIQSDSVVTEVIEAQIEPESSENEDGSYEAGATAQGDDSLTRQFANGLALFWQEKGEEIIARVVMAFNASRESFEGEPESEEPIIEYVDRQHALLWIVEFSVFALLFVGATAAYGFFAGNLFASLVGVTIVSLLVLLGIRISSMYLDSKPHLRASKAQTRTVRFLLGIYVVVLCAIFVTVLNGLDVNVLMSFAYLVVSLVLIYLSLKEHYKWAELRYRREGNVLYAERPARSRYFLPTLKTRLVLLNVNTCRMAQTWFEERVLKMYRLKLTIDASMGESSSDYESETVGMNEAQKRRHAKVQAKEAAFWRDLRFIRRGDVLADAIVQGSIMKRR